MFESKSGILAIAGLGFFALAFVSNALLPALMYENLAEQSVEELVANNENVMVQFETLAKRYPDQFAEHFGEPTEEACAEALELGRKVYTGEGCWHCHSQFIRPVSNEDERWGPVAESWEYQNELQRPVLFGTRRVGPDLSREAGVRSHDWHAVHFYQPDMVSPDSPMPRYEWFFDGSPAKPNKRGLAIITYVQWLGSWRAEYPLYDEAPDMTIRDLPPYVPPTENDQAAAAQAGDAQAGDGQAGDGQPGNGGN